MANANRGREREVLADRPNQVISATEVKVLAFRFTNGGGEVDVSLALCFGKDNEDGGPGIWVISPADFKAALKVPLPQLKKGLRQKLESMAKGADLEGADELADFGQED